MKRIFSIALTVLLLGTVLNSCAKERELPPAEYSLMTHTVNTRLNGIGITLVFPVVSGYEDKVAESRINGCLEEYAWEMFHRKNLVADDAGGYEYSVTEVQVTLATTGFFSAYVMGFVASEDTGRTENFSYTINCDLNSGVLYKAEELLSSYEPLAERFVKGQFKKVFGHAELLENSTYADMLLPYRAEYAIYPDIFFTETGVGFLIEVVPSLGGCAGFTLPFRSALDGLDLSNPMVSFVTGTDRR